MINSAPTGILRQSAPSSLARTFSVLTGSVGVLLLAGCVFGGGPRGTVEVLRETPVPSEIMVESGMSPPAACVVDVNQSPPAPKTEQQPEPPAKNAVWLSGNWRYYTGRYVWVAGHWATPPKPHAVYEQPHWTVRNGNNMFAEGYWHF